MKALPYIATWLLSLAAAYILGSRRPLPEPEIIIERHTDTVRVLCPEVEAIYIRGAHEAVLPIAADSSRVDSVAVIVPVSQAVYSGDNYRAFVSGYRPRLDSLIFTQAHTTISPAQRVKTSRWSIGVTAGYGITPAGFQPFIGVGVSFRIY